jgi:hypothetical protein
VKESRFWGRLRPHVGRGLVAAVVAVTFVQSIRVSADAPPLQLPWPTGQQQIAGGPNGGNTYGCNDHTLSDYYAIDFALPSGTAVSAAASGTISATGFVSDYGNYVLIDHNGSSYRSLCAHLSSIPVSVGAIVAQGQLIGYSGSTGHSTGPHLHFAMRQGGTGLYDGTAYKPEPMSAYTGFGAYGCGGPSSPWYTSTAPIVRPFTGANWLLRNTNNSGSYDYSFWYGIPGDVPVTGMWCSIGLPTGPGVFRTSTGTWYLHCSSTHTDDGQANSFQYGWGSDIPVVGDWIAQGNETIGVVRPQNGGLTWYLTAIAQEILIYRSLTVWPRIFQWSDIGMDLVSRQ